MADRHNILLDALRQAMLKPELVCAVEQIHREITGELQAIGPVCQMSGRCCRFEDYGHRLYVSTAELAAFASRLLEHPELSGPAAGSDGGGCRFQVGKTCVAHVLRPMGCRLFFCDDRTEAQLQALYERMHRKVKDLHERFGVPYLYVEWRQGLCAVESLLSTRRADCPKP